MVFRQIISANRCKRDNEKTPSRYDVTAPSPWVTGTGHCYRACNPRDLWLYFAFFWLRLGLSDHFFTSVEFSFLLRFFNHATHALSIRHWTSPLPVPWPPGHRGWGCLLSNLFAVAVPFDPLVAGDTHASRVPQDFLIH